MGRTPIEVKWFGALVALQLLAPLAGCEIAVFTCVCDALDGDLENDDGYIDRFEVLSPLDGAMVTGDLTFDFDVVVEWEADPHHANVTITVPRPPGSGYYPEVTWEGEPVVFSMAGETEPRSIEIMLIATSLVNYSTQIKMITIDWSPAPGQ